MPEPADGIRVFSRVRMLRVPYVGLTGVVVWRGRPGSEDRDLLGVELQKDCPEALGGEQRLASGETFTTAPRRGVLCPTSAVRPVPERNLSSGSSGESKKISEEEEDGDEQSLSCEGDGEETRWDGVTVDSGSSLTKEEYIRGKEKYYCDAGQQRASWYEEEVQSRKYHHALWACLPKDEEQPQAFDELRIKSLVPGACRYTPIPRLWYNDPNRSDIGVAVLMQNPLICAVPDFLSPETCKYYIGLGSQSLDSEGYYEEWPSQAMVPNGVRAGVRLDVDEAHLIKKRMREIMDLPEENWSLVDVVKYWPGESMTQHTDYEEAEEEYNPDNFIVASVFVFLNKVQGGEFVFGHCGIKVAPATGLAIVHFPAVKNEVNGKVIKRDDRTMHGTCESPEEKWLLRMTGWARPLEVAGQNVPSGIYAYDD